jgi:hypothetical protein
MHIRQRYFLLILVMLAIACSQSEKSNQKTTQKTKLCQVGDTGSYIPEDEQCINTAAQCESKGGVWLGSISGRGRDSGCDLPTKDAGRKCSDGSQCESICVANDLSNKNCSCSARTLSRKGLQPDICSFGGLIRGAQVD